MIDQAGPLQKIVDEALEASRNRKACDNALALLFPRVRKLNDSIDIVLGSETRDRGSHRIWDTEYSSSYFALNPRPGTWGLSEIHDVIEAEAPDAAFTKIASKIGAAATGDRREMRRSFLDVLDNEFDPRKSNSPQWLLALLDAAPVFITRRYDDEGGDIFFRNADRLRRIVARALEPLQPTERAKLVLDWVSSVRDLTILCDVVRGVAGDKRAGGASGSSGLGFGSQTDEIRGALLERVRALAARGELWSQADPTDILWFWWGCDVGDEVRAFTDEAMRQPFGLRSLLELTVSRIASSSGDYDIVKREMWSKNVDIGNLENRAHGLLNDNPSTEDAEVAERFLKALEKGVDDPF
jgi:hypothetical protein